jgi:hypothetical protein
MSMFELEEVNLKLKSLQNNEIKDRIDDISKFIINDDTIKPKFNESDSIKILKTLKEISNSLITLTSKIDSFTDSEKATNQSNLDQLNSPLFSPDKMEENNLKKVFKDTFDNTHAFPKFFLKKDHYFIKLLWLLALVSSISGCSYIIIEQIIQFNKFDIVTNIRVYRENESTFPMVTICPNNRLGNNKTLKLFQNFLNKTDKEMLKIHANDIYSIWPLVLNNLTDYQIKEFSLDFKQLLKSCHFGGEICQADDFIWHYDPFYDICYTFNSGYDRMGGRVATKKIKSPGTLSGLTLDIAYIDEHKLFPSNFFGSKLEVCLPAFFDLFINSVF